MTLHGHVTVWADLLFFETTWFYTTSYAALSPRHYNRQEVLRCSCGVAQKDSCTVCGRTAFTPCHRPHSQPSICAGGEKGTLVHGRTVSACCTHCMSPRRRSKASTVARGVGVKLVLVVRCVPLSCLAPPFTLSRARCAVAWLAVTDSRLSPLSHGGKTEVCRAALP